MTPHNKRIILSVILFLFVSWLALRSGAVSLPLRVFLFDGSEAERAILWQVRAPRVVLAGIVGAALALSGLVFQTLLQNPLAEPYTLGASSGAALLAVMTMTFGWTALGLWTVPVFAMLGSVGTLLLLFTFVRLIDRTFPMTIVLLMGLLIGSFFGALVSLLVVWSGDELRSVIHWLFGSVAMRSWEHVAFASIFIGLSAFTLFLFHRSLDALQFGEREAFIAGVDVVSVKKYTLIFAAILTGAAVAVSGVIGFVGLIIPHVTRKMFGYTHRVTMPLAMIYGATFLILIDWLSRVLLAPRELPLGVMTALIGAPIVAYIFYYYRKEAI